MTLKESIPLNEKNSVKHTPELKEGNPERIKAVFGSQAKYAQRMIDVLKAAGVDPKDVWAQSFNKDDVLYWIQNEPKFGKQAVYLDSIDPTVTPAIPRLSFDELKQLKKKDSDMYKALDVFARQVGIIGISSDWAATVTYYANCMGLK